MAPASLDVAPITRNSQVTSLLTSIFILLLFYPLLDVDLDVVCFIFLAGTMLSPWFRFLLRLDMYHTYADLTILFLSEAYDLFQFLQFVCIIFSFVCFPPEVSSAPELLEPVL